MTTAKPSTPHPITRVRRKITEGFSTWSSLQSILTIAVLMATLFTVFMPANLFANQSLDKLMSAAEPDLSPTQPPATTATPSGAPRIGIISGHKGNFDDPGAVCADGLLPFGLSNEAQVNERISTLVVQKLTSLGYQVDLLDEFDPRLENYQAVALVSIHNDSCGYVNDEATGYKVSAAMMNSNVPAESERLTACMVQRYGALTQMKYHFNSITEDMTYYHVFNEIGDNTPAAIIETGFLNIDGNFLVSQSDLVAQAVVSGILCYVNNEPVQPDPTPTPTPAIP